MEEILKLACSNGLALVIAVWAIIRLDKFLQNLNKTLSAYNEELKGLHDTLTRIQQTLELTIKP